jgi:tripartite-type tricarboxylate transporter receptor subunit TctC
MRFWSRRFCACSAVSLLLCSAVSLVLSLAVARPALAEPIKLVVPFAAGGPVDQLARVLANGLGPKLGEDVIVDDRGGAGGAIGCEFAARAKPDGKTVLLASLGALVISPILKPPADYDPVKSFEPVMLVGSVPSLIVVNPKSGIATLADLIAKAKQQHLSYGSAGPGTTMNIALEMLNKAAGVKITHVPYRGAAPAITDLLGGHIDTLNADLPVLLPLVKAGKIKALAVFSPERTPLLPDLPTTKELGFPGLVVENWYGVLLPAGTPKNERDRLEKALFAVIGMPNVKARFAADGTHGALDHRAFAAMLSKQFAAWPGRIKALGISSE